MRTAFRRIVNVFDANARLPEPVQSGSAGRVFCITLDIHLNLTIFTGTNALSQTCIAQGSLGGVDRMSRFKLGGNVTPVTLASATRSSETENDPGSVGGEA